MLLYSTVRLVRRSEGEKYGTVLLLPSMLQWLTNSFFGHFRFVPNFIHQICEIQKKSYLGF